MTPRTPTPPPPPFALEPRCHWCLGISRVSREGERRLGETVITCEVPYATVRVFFLQSAKLEAFWASKLCFPHFQAFLHLRDTYSLGKIKSRHSTSSQVWNRLCVTWNFKRDLRDSESSNQQAHSPYHSFVAILLKLFQTTSRAVYTDFTDHVTIHSNSMAAILRY